ncbi:transcription factor 7-like 2 isoform X2 [Branchiostoma floridae]|uniref:Transcription factor 7-like 2 isoform X2 n=1 Tax=Branchiostoma floridae TaxID=7739 RepID=A0A9J7MKU1_BRAFL|nr:transcription factor 7-like 2 isoform X2 [Branchiostoma floridae]
MPQLNGSGGDDLGASDETISFKDEGEQEEKSAENVSNDLSDIKSSLVNESESSQSGAVPSEGSKPPLQSYPREDSRRGDEGSKAESVPVVSRGPAYLTPGGVIVSNMGVYPHPNGSLAASATSNKVSVVHGPPHPGPLTQLMMYSNEHFAPGTPPHIGVPPNSIEVDPKTGIPRPRHPADLPPMYAIPPNQLPQLGPSYPKIEEYHSQALWQSQGVYPISAAGYRHPYPTAIAVNATNMPREEPIGLRDEAGYFLLGRYPVLQHPHHPGMPPTGIPHPAIVSPHGMNLKHDPSQMHQKQDQKKEPEKKKPHIKKPLNAFMLYMKEMRAKVVAECTLKESAAINQILGRRWHALPREEQAKYYELARKERQLHMQLYPGWSARDNYVQGKKKKRKRDKQQGDTSEVSNPKKCRARFGLDQQQAWCKPCRKKKCIRYIGDDGDSDDASTPGTASSPLPLPQQSPIALTTSPFPVISHAADLSSTMAGPINLSQSSNAATSSATLSTYGSELSKTVPSSNNTISVSTPSASVSTTLPHSTGSSSSSQSISSQPNKSTPNT